MRKRLLKKELAERVTEIAAQEKICSSLLIQILHQMFYVYMDYGVLEAICTLLIRAEKREGKYFRWYEAGVKAGLKITRLFEYYMYSISTDYLEVLPKSILLYFLYNAGTLQEKQSFLYHNIIRNKDELGDIYRSYLKKIEKYATDNGGRKNRRVFISNL